MGFIILSFLCEQLAVRVILRVWRISLRRRVRAAAAIVIQDAVREYLTWYVFVISVELLYLFLRTGFYLEIPHDYYWLKYSVATDLILFLGNTVPF